MVFFSSEGLVSTAKGMVRRVNTNACVCSPGGYWCKWCCYGAKPGWTIGVRPGSHPGTASSCRGRLVVVFAYTSSQSYILLPTHDPLGCLFGLEPSNTFHLLYFLLCHFFFSVFLLYLNCRFQHLSTAALFPLYLEICIFSVRLFHSKWSFPLLHLSAVKVWTPLRACKSSTVDILSHSILTLKHDAAVTHSSLWYLHTSYPTITCFIVWVCECMCMCASLICR